MPSRRTFLIQSAMGMGTLMGLSAFAKELNNLSEADEKMPVLFLGHGNPMNAITDNEFSKSWAKLGTTLKKPKAILCVSAHWLTKGTKVTAMEQPKTIHDFGGFPDELFAQQYSAPGAPALAGETKQLISKSAIELDYDWGLDHGTWSVLLPMFPKADIPVFQLSIDYTKPEQYHFDLAKELSALRKKGVLIIGSGNIVHNLSMVNFRNPQVRYDWATEFDEKIKQFIKNGDLQSVIDYKKLGRVADMAVPSNDHYLPLLYTLALKDKNESVSFFNDVPDLGAVTMTSLKIE